jgi:hypothetical protein
MKQVFFNVFAKHAAFVLAFSKNAPTLGKIKI